MLVPELTPEYRESYLRALAEGMNVPPDPVLSPDQIAAILADPDVHFEALANPPSTVRLPTGEDVPVPRTSRFWVIEGGEVVGGVQLRHELDSAVVAAYVGHVSLGIRPSSMGRWSMATEIEAILIEAAAIGIERLMLTARSTNKRSVNLIKRRVKGVIFVDEVPIPYSPEPASMTRFVVPTDPWRRPERAAA